MEFKNRFLNRLFGSEAKKTDKTLPPKQTGQAQGEQVLPSPSVNQNQLELPFDHALNRLYSLWSKQQKNAPLPFVCLEGHKSLSPEETKKELERLRRELTDRAVVRLREAQPKAQEDGKETAVSGQEQNAGAEARPVKLDAQPFLFISSDCMAAWLMVFPPVGEGKEPDTEMLKRALAENKITFGVDWTLLERLSAEPERYFHLFLIAEGMPVKHGKDGYIEDFFERTAKPKLTEDEYGRVDHFNLNLFQNIEKGTVICQSVPPEKGTPGRTVQNVEIPCKEGKEAPLPKGRNTTVSEDGRQLLASLSGRVEFSGRSFQVKNVLDINGNVDLSTGNINYMGDVHIHGDVCGGFTVRAMGNVTIDGVVEVGEIEAGGDLRVIKGIQGDSHVVIRSHHSLYAKYMENCVVHVRENLFADCIVNCDVYCDGEINVCSGRGTIIGGRIRSANRITAKIVGSRSEIATAVFLGGQPCADFERKFLQQRADELGSELKKIERQNNSPEKVKQLNKVRLELSVAKMKLAQFDKDLEKLKETLEEQGGCRLKCDIAYPGLVLTIGSDTLHLTQETSCVNGRLVDGEVRVL